MKLRLKNWPCVASWLCEEVAKYKRQYFIYSKRSGDWWHQFLEMLFQKIYKKLYSYYVTQRITVYIHIYIYIYIYIYICVCVYLYIFIYVCIYIYLAGDLSRGWPKVSPISGLLHFTLDSYFIMLSVKKGGIKDHFFESLIWLNQWLKPDLPDQRRTLYSSSQCMNL